MIYNTENGVIWSRHLSVKAAVKKAKKIRRKAEKNNWRVPTFQVWSINGQWDVGDNPARHHWDHYYGEVTITKWSDER